MKGRRKARELALQALYELDQSSHALDDVLAARVEGAYQVLADSAADPAQRQALLALLSRRDFRREPPDPWSAEVADPPAELGLEEDLATSSLALLRRHGPMVNYGVVLVRGVTRHLTAIDAVIHRIAPEWPVAQMAPVDRNLLRIALWEIGSRAVPLRVAIHEAVELARRYSGESARRMVNGALGNFAKNAPGDLNLPAYAEAAGWDEVPAEPGAGDHPQVAATTADAEPAASDHG